jgi:hypothetical protein
MLRAVDNPMVAACLTLLGGLLTIQCGGKETSTPPLFTGSCRSTSVEAVPVQEGGIVFNLYGDASTITHRACTESYGLTVEQVASFKESCEQDNDDAGLSGNGDAGAGAGIYSDEPCPSADRVCGCRFTMGQASETTWFYDQSPAAGLCALCTIGGGTSVPP